MLELKNKIWKEINKITIDPFTEYDFLVEIKRVLDKYLVEKESNPELYNSLFENATIEDAKKVMQNMFNDITPEQFEELKKQALENVKKNNMRAKEKTAQEMFEELGYKLDTAEENARLYCRDILDNKTFGYKDSEMIYFDDEYNGIYFTNKEHLNMAELQAINKQVEELGWNK